jgi:hypothetical protein
MNKLIILFLLSEKTGKILPNTPGKECPSKDERTLKDIFCKEPK